MIKKTLLVLIGSMGKQMPNPLFGVGAAFCTTTKLLILWVYSLSNIFFWIPILCSWHSHKTLNHTRRYIVSFAKNRHESRLIWWHHLSRSYHLWCGISGGGVSRCLHQVNRYRIKYMSLLGLRRQIHKLKAGSSRFTLWGRYFYLFAKSHEMAFACKLYNPREHSKVFDGYLFCRNSSGNAAWGNWWCAKNHT